MKRHIKQAIIRGLMGAFLGLGIGYTILMLLFTFEEGFVVNPDEVKIHYFAALFVGFWMSASTEIFSVDAWSILKQTIVHSIVNAPYLIVAFAIGWAPTSIVGGVLFVASYFVLYALIWLAFKAYWTKRANELNVSLRNLE